MEISTIFDFHISLLIERSSAISGQDVGFYDIYSALPEEAFHFFWLNPVFW